jgi:hypothetical protein
MLYYNERPTGEKQQLLDGKTVENKGKLILINRSLTVLSHMELKHGSLTKS